MDEATAYAVTKAAQQSLSRVFADTYASDGVLVNAVAPGATSSELWIGPLPFPLTVTERLPVTLTERSPPTGTGAAQILSVYGRIGAGQNVPAASYSDTVVVTVTF